MRKMLRNSKNFFVTLQVERFFIITMKVKIHHEGANILLVLFLIIVATGVMAYSFFDYKPVAIALIVLMAILFLLVLNFFRLPRRHFKGDNNDGTAVVSSVDGTVVALEEVYEDEYLHRNVIQLSVFMTVFNVHANWVPVKGEITYVKHHSGRFLAANLPKSSSDNERSSIVISTSTGEEVLVRQIAGAVARRIVTYVEQGETVDINDFIGFIKFGSRVDIFLPLDTEIMVKLGDRTWGGETLIARLKNR
jgi:phosphatidylserine decarboxylase